MERYNATAIQLYSSGDLFMPFIGGTDGCPAGSIVVEQDAGTGEQQSRMVKGIDELFVAERELAVLGAGPWRTIQ